MKMKRGIFAFMVVALISVSMATVASAAPVNPGAGNSYIWIMDTTGTGASVLVEWYAYNNGTTPALQKSYTLGNYGSVAIAPGDTGFGAGWRGTAVVSSDELVAAAVYNEYDNSLRAAAYRGVDNPAPAQFMPFINYQANGVRDFNLAIYNVSASTTPITLTYYNRLGQLDFTVTDSIPAGQQVYYDTTVGGAKVPNFAGTTYYATYGAWAGAVKIQAQQDIAAVMTHHYASYSGQYTGSSSGSSKVFVPYVARRRGVVGSSGVVKVATNISIQNLSASSTALVTTTFIGNLVGDPTLVITDSIAPNAVAAFHTVSGGATHTQAVFYVLDRQQPAGHGAANTGTDEWVGSAIVESNGPQLAVVATTIRDENPTMGQYTAGGSAGASTECFFPTVHRIQASGFDTDGKYAYVRLQNPGVLTATYSMHFYNRDGSEVLPVVATQTNIALGPGKSTSPATKSADFAILGTNWTGSLRIVSNEPILCVDDAVNGPIRQWTYEGNW